jgi:hypothetical protein
MNGEFQRVQSLAKQRGYYVFDAGDDRYRLSVISSCCGLSYSLPHISETLDHIRAFLTSGPVEKVRRLGERYNTIIDDMTPSVDTISDWGSDLPPSETLVALNEEYRAIEAEIDAEINQPGAVWVMETETVVS